MHSFFINFCHFARSIFGTFLILTTVFSVGLHAQKPPLIVTTDIGQDPDDQQSFVRLLHYANEFHLLGLIANADSNYKHEPPIVKDSILHHLISKYAQIEDNLRRHSKDYPTADYLHTLVKRGTAGNGGKIPLEDYVGAGHDTEGSNWIVEVVTKSKLPVNIAVWGGACDLAQALWKVRETYSKKEMETFIQKLRVYFIGKQDSSNDWIIQQFPQLWLILALDASGDKWASSYRGMFLGGDISLTSKEWLHQHIIGKNPLADEYPDKAYTGGEKRNPYMAMKEGDSPSWFYFLPNGLNFPNHPEWGGWGGRFQEEHPNFYVDVEDEYHDTEKKVTSKSCMASVFRWRPDFQNDFAARVEWGMDTAPNANHHPIPSIIGYEHEEIVEMEVKAGSTLILDASNSIDPDRDSLSFHWLVYPQKKSLRIGDNFLLGKEREPKISVDIPKQAKGNISLVLKVMDNGRIPLVGYKRVILHIEH